MTAIYVTRRDNSREPYNNDKIKARLLLACKGIAGVSATMILTKARIQITDGIRTSKITELLIEAATNLILGGNHNYQLVAGRLIMLDIREQAYKTPTTDPIGLICPILMPMPAFWLMYIKIADFAAAISMMESPTSIFTQELNCRSRVRNPAMIGVGIEMS